MTTDGRGDDGLAEVGSLLCDPADRHSIITLGGSSHAM